MTLEEQIKALIEAKEKEQDSDKDDSDDEKGQADRVDQDPAVKIENPMDPNLTSSETPEGEIAAADAQGEEMESKMKPVKENKSNLRESVADLLTDKYKPSEQEYSIDALKSIPKDQYESHAKWLASEFHKQNVRNEDEGIRSYHKIANLNNLDDLGWSHHGYADQAHIIKTLKHMKDVHGVSVKVRTNLSNKEYDDLTNTSRGYGRGSDLRESVADLLGDEFTDEFKVKAHTIFEAAVKDQVIKFQAKLQEEHNAAVAKLDEQFEEKFIARSKHLEEETSDKIDGYLNFLAEEWKKENEVALEVAIKSELTESFINSLKTVFEQHYIDLPEDKVDLYAKVVEEKSEVETALATTVGSLAKLTEELNQIKREQIIAEAVKEFSSMDKSRFHSLTEDFAFEDAESFKTKVGIVKKSFFGNKSTAKEQLAEEFAKTETIVETNEPVNLNENTAMSKYVNTLKKK